MRGWCGERLVLSGFTDPNQLSRILLAKTEFVVMLVTHFPSGEVVAKLAVSLAIGLLLGIGREWYDKARALALSH